MLMTTIDEGENGVQSKKHNAVLATTSRGMDHCAGATEISTGKA